MQLSSLQCGDSAKIIDFHNTEKAYRHQLLSMGLVPGTHFTLTRVAPLGDPVEISLRGFTLCLRKQEAAALIVERVSV